MGEPDAKRQKTEESKDVEMKDEAPKELETDCKESKAKPLKEEVSFEASECTLNVVPSLGGRVLMPLTDGGMQYLIAGARANVGIKKGRYLYEVKIVESLTPSEGAARSRAPPGPRNLVRLGFSTKESPLLLGETDESVFFDNEGFFTCEKTKKESVSQRFQRDQVLAVLLNLDDKSDNKNTVSLFRDGVRVSQPQKLPDALVGKPLFPHVGFKNVTLQVNFGPQMVPLPFKCHTVAQAGATDGVNGPAHSGKCEVVFPVGLPDEGTFDWLDGFLEKNPKFFELSDRAILKWAEKSGIPHNKAASWKHSNDKPDPQFGMPLLDDFSTRRVINAVAATQPRNYVVMEVKANLIKEERTQLLKRFQNSCFKTVAEVVMGEPTPDFKAKTHTALLADKQEKEDKEWEQRKIAKKAEREMRIKQKKLEAAKKKAELEAAKKLEELEKEKQEAEKKAAEAAEGGEGEKKEGEADRAEKVEKKEEDVKMEDVKEEVKEEEEKEEEEPEEPEEPKPVAVLTAEEKAVCFPKKPVTDLTSWVLSSSFAQFSLPDKKEEGFDDVRYAWTKEKGCEDYLKKWILKNKITTRLEDLSPGEWFKTKYAEWQKVLAEWHAKQKEYEAKAPVPAPPPAPAPAPEGAEGEAKEGEEKKDMEMEEAPKVEKKQAEDVFAVENVCDTGDGVPLFHKFSFEDWALLSLRLELHLLVHSFKKDANDEDRVGIHEQHLAFYYNKYYKKTFSVKYYGMETNSDLIGLVKDTVTILPENQVLKFSLGEDMENFDIFVKLTEEARRERLRRLDAGDTSAQLKFQKPDAPPPPPPQHQNNNKGGGGGYKGDKGGYKGGFKGDKGYDKGYKGGFKGDKGFKGDYKGGYGKGFKGDKGFGKGGYGKGFK
eukprot:CAMPEP_0197663666 /NCGR_PEP_ID=MMETSP1338-20131121/58167_1 /TAXON_ID=43686 ORGANISM="Pelagodinium beii, Strain RCC1491" /NCGR_SAMPLE_ID=MMETSP1338 /ASSEMBLY_ACC=CAM_ASM_000754 /LENGTH=882 /DNA_ID=CAMNT_0043242147 /DNA_START=79 /DNA_END=2727 /DNA_ORIENTATION=+